MSAVAGSMTDDLSELKYQGRIDFEVSNNSHTIAYKLIRELGGGAVRRILEVGCAGGYFGLALREQGYHVTGVELDAAAAAVARTRLDEVFEGSIEQFIGARRSSAAPFDCIVFGDVLEHLADPLSILLECKALLAPRGLLVASIPNVAHISVRAMLLEGRWELSDLGIMDRTHLRFFAKDTLVELFNEAGFAIERLDYAELSPEHVQVRCAAQTIDTVRSLCRDDLTHVFQFIAAVRPQPDPSLRNRRYTLTHGRKVLCAVPILDSGLAEVRLRAPLVAWRSRYGGQVRLVSLTGVSPEDLAWADVVVIQRIADDFVLDLTRSIQAHGIPLVFDLDDYLLDVPHFLESADYCRRHRSHLKSMLRNANVVTTTTSRLQDALRTHGTNVMVVPNCTRNHRPPVSHDNDASVRLLIASSDSIRVDFITDALKCICAEFGSGVQVVAIGPPGAALNAAGVPTAQVQLLPHEDFQRFLSSQPNSIGIIPLDDSYFSSCKSAIKYVDYALAGIPVVCSAVPPYSDVMEQGVTGWLAANNEPALVDALRNLVRSAEARRQLAYHARERCLRDFSMDVAAAAWRRVFAALGPRREPAAHEEFPRTRAKRRVLAFARRMLRPSSYSATLRIVRVEGLRGLGKRLRALR